MGDNAFKDYKWFEARQPYRIWHWISVAGWAMAIGVCLGFVLLTLSLG